MQFLPKSKKLAVEIASKRFMVDTAYETNVVTSALAKEWGMQQTEGATRVNGLVSSDKKNHVRWPSDVTFCHGGRHLRGKTIVHDAAVSKGFDGILGTPFLRSIRNGVVLDIPKKQMILSPSRERWRKANIVKAFEGKSDPDFQSVYVVDNIGLRNIHNNETLNGPFIFDTGSPYTVLDEEYTHVHGKMNVCPRPLESVYIHMSGAKTLAAPSIFAHGKDHQDTTRVYCLNDSPKTDGNIFRRYRRTGMVGILGIDVAKDYAIWLFPSGKMYWQTHTDTRQL